MMASYMTPLLQRSSIYIAYPFKRNINSRRSSFKYIDRRKIIVSAGTVVKHSPTRAGTFVALTFLSRCISTRYVIRGGYDHAWIEYLLHKITKPFLSQYNIK